LLPLPQRAVLFDYDDTLVQTRQCKYRALAALAERHYGAQLSSATIDAHWGVPYEALFTRLFAHLDQDIPRVIRRYEALDLEFPVLAYDDAVATLEALLARDVVVGVVTSAGEIVHAQMAAVGIPSARLCFVQTARDTPYHKPDPRVFAPALEKLHARGIAPSVEVRAQNSLSYVGDSLTDFRAAQGAGLSFVGIHGRTTDREAFSSAGARSVASLSELLGELSLDSPD
jgi:phosphoglycolate phosphatase